jgi:NAD(P)-dependent dehydrogenase (short-subunit alcohol dehydrogenase family)
MSRLQDKVALVTGGGSGIGGAIAHRFAAEGATVYATSRSAGEAAPQPSAETGTGRIVPLRADAGTSAGLAQVFDRIRADAGRIDVLVINAGISEYAMLGDVSEDLFERTFALNARAALFAAQGALELMPPGGSIVLIGSIAGAIGTKGYGVYGASKAALRAFARTWANELAPKGIRVNVVSPGPVDTAMFDAVSDEVRKAITGLVPMGRLGRAEEVAAAALFLASSESSFTTGAELAVDGGMAQV